MTKKAFKFENVHIKKLEDSSFLSNNVYAVIGGADPSGSIKDRAVYQMLVEYSKIKGDLKDYLIVEATSGNTGISLAYFSKIFGYQLKIVLPKTSSIQRQKIISSYGGELVLVDGGMKECSEVANKIILEHSNAFIFNQFNNKNNALGHYLLTAKSIYSQIGKIDYLFAGIGTGGTISGVGKYLKEKSNTKIIGVEPLQSPLLTRGISNSHLIQGIGANFIPRVLDMNVVDEIIDVDDQTSVSLTKWLNEKYQLDIGYSGTACYLALIQYLKSHNIKNKNIVIIFPDRGDRYQ